MTDEVEDKGRDKYDTLINSTADKMISQFGAGGGWGGRQEKEMDAKIKNKILDAGWLGKIFGAKSDPRYNIIGLILICFGVIGGVDTLWQTFKCSHPVNLELWKIFLPIFTLAFGYLFAKAPSSDSE